MKTASQQLLHSAATTRTQCLIPDRFSHAYRGLAHETKSGCNQMVKAHFLGISQTVKRCSGPHHATIPLAIKRCGQASSQGQFWTVKKSWPLVMAPSLRRIMIHIIICLLHESNREEGWKLTTKHRRQCHTSQYACQWQSVGHGPVVQLDDTPHSHRWRSLFSTLSQYRFATKKMSLRPNIPYRS